MLINDILMKVILAKRYCVQYLFFAVLLFLISCNVKDRVPGHIPSKKKMTDLLVDIHLADNVINIDGISQKNKQLGYYRYVLDRQGVTQAEFDSALSWYSAHPKVYLEVYDNVIEILTEKEADLQQAIKAGEQLKKDSIDKIKDLWTDVREFRLPLHDTLDATIPFSIPLDSLKNGKLKLSTWITYKKDDLGKKDELVLITCYADSTRDTLRTNIVKAFTRVNAAVTQNLKQDTAVVLLEGFLLFHESKSKRHLSIEQVSLEHIPQSDKRK